MIQIWKSWHWSNAFPGFYNNYFWKMFPQYFITLWIADTLGMFTYWQNDYFTNGGTNTGEDNDY